jgi:hypothetical protein
MRWTMTSRATVCATCGTRFAAGIGPRLKRMQLQLDNMESAINLALITRYTELSSQPSREPTYRLPGPIDRPL